MRRHLVAAWNPRYGPDVMEMHLTVLQQAVRALRRGELDGRHDVYVWWGKVRSPNRQQPLPHLADVLALETEHGPDDPSPETHLYLTDYRSLYVAHLGEVTREDVRDDAEERDRIPPYYLSDGVACDCWFLLWDVRRLVTDDTVSVIDELRKLRNTRYHDRPVSIYGGMVDLPLLVTETEETHYFDHATRETLIGDRFWVEFDAERVGIGVIERELRENLFGDPVWRAFDPVTRSFVATGEKIYRDHADDPAFDFSPVIVEFSKALEARIHRLLRRALGGAPPEVRLATADGRRVDLAAGGSLSLGGLARYLSDRALSEYLSGRLKNAAWFTMQLPAVLDALVDVRNDAAHRGRVDREVAGRWRRRLVGIGCEGEFVRLAGVTPC